ncbi:MAG: Hpt domain-containing protein [Saprospiraceae bacterium]
MDLNYLRQLFAHDDAMVARFIGLFRGQAPLLVGEIRQALDGSDFAAAARAAHTLKSQLRYLSETPLAELAQSLEAHAEAGRADACAHDFEALETKLVDCLERLAGHGMS